jgi:hypothetical protein
MKKAVTVAAALKRKFQESLQYWVTLFDFVSRKQVVQM